MKTRRLFLNLAIGITTLLFGLAWVGVYQFFLGAEIGPTTSRQAEKIAFDINDPNSVLPIDYKEEELSDPKEDESNPKHFDPEGSYYFNDGMKPKGFEEVFYFDIYNKNFDVDPESESYGDLIAPTGTLAIQGEDDTKFLSFKSISVEDGKLKFVTEAIDGISYQFSGEFLVNGNFYTLDADADVLKGELKRLENNKVVLLHNIVLSWTMEDGC